MSGASVGRQVGNSACGDGQAALVAHQQVQIGVTPHPLGRLAEPVLAPIVDGLGENDDPMLGIRLDDLLAMPLIAVEIPQVAAAVANDNRVLGEGGKAEIVGVPSSHDAEVCAGRPAVRPQHDKMIARVAVYGVIQQCDRPIPPGLSRRAWPPASFASPARTSRARRATAEEAERGRDIRRNAT